MVDLEINRDEQWVVFSTDKMKAKYKLTKDRSGHRFFEFSVDKGALPKELRGKFSSLEKGIKHFTNYERTLKKSHRVRRDEWQEEKEANRVKLHSESS